MKQQIKQESRKMSRNEFESVFGYCDCTEGYHTRSIITTYKILKHIFEKPDRFRTKEEIRCRYPLCGQRIDGEAAWISAPNVTFHWHPECFDKDSLVTGMLQWLQQPSFGTSYPADPTSRHIGREKMVYEV